MEPLSSYLLSLNFAPASAAAGMMLLKESELLHLTDDQRIPQKLCMQIIFFYQGNTVLNNVGLIITEF